MFDIRPDLLLNCYYSLCVLLRRRYSDRIYLGLNLKFSDALQLKCAVSV
jgi:hypothetical protein